MDADTISIVDNALISVWIYPARRMIHHRMKAYCHGGDFREALIKGVEAMARHQAIKWLSDDRANGAIVPEDTAWAVQHWLPRAKAAGWKHWSIIQPAKLIGQINMERARKELAVQGINARMFGDPALAMQWLDAQ